MGKKERKKQPPKEMPKVHPELEGFEVHINSFGEIVTSIEIEKVNDFLSRNLYDKKLRNKDAKYFPKNFREEDEENEESGDK